MNPIDNKNSGIVSPSTSTSALTLALILLLTLTWLLSLRPIRLKIGDYYFNQGKFDQAVNWYKDATKPMNTMNSINATKITKEDVALPFWDETDEPNQNFQE